jgi:hypothetical protein
LARPAREHSRSAQQIARCGHHVLAVLVGEDLADARLGPGCSPLSPRRQRPQPDQVEQVCSM